MNEKTISNSFPDLQSMKCPFRSGDYLVNQFAADSYSTDFQIFTLNGISIGIENDLLSEALQVQTINEYSALFYFMDMSDSEIADAENNRSTVYRHRTSGLAMIKKFMENLKNERNFDPFPHCKGY